MTVLGVLFLPAILICFFWRPLYLLPLLVVASVFEAGSIFNGSIGEFEFGVSPFYLTEIFIFLRLVVLLFKGTSILPQRESRARRIAIIMCIFWAWCFASAFILPHVFAGTLVAVPRAQEEEFAPVQWTLSNLAQAGYLTLNVGALLYAVHTIRTHRQTEQLMNAFYWALVVVVFIGIGQFLFDTIGADFPYEWFNNNPAYAQGIDQQLGAVHRVNSTFTEPSTAGSYLAAVTCGLMAGFFSGKRSLFYFLGLLGATLVLFLTTSSTGFVSLVGGLCLLMLYFRLHRRHKETRKHSGRGWLVLFSIAIAVGVVLWLVPDLPTVILAMTIEKGESYSLWFRLAEELHSLGVFLSTYGLGVGLGSSRSSGLLPTMLSSVGLVGTALFGYVLYRMIKWFLGSSAPIPLRIVFWSLVTLTIGEIVAVPDLNRPVMWTLLAMVFVHLNVHASQHPSLEVARETKPAPIRPQMRPSPGVIHAD